MCKSVYIKNTSTTNVQTWRRQMCKGSILTWNVQTSHKCANHCFHQESSTFVQTFHPQMCKQPHLCKHFTLKCANNHICANMALWNVQICKKKKKKIHQPLMCKYYAVWSRRMYKIHKCANNHICVKILPSKCANNHICANTAPSNVQTTRFVQTFHPQMCKQPYLCKHFTLKCAINHICANTAPSNVQICKYASTAIVQTWRLQMCKGSILTWNLQLTSH